MTAEMSALEDEAMRTLASGGCPIADASEQVPSVPGLYAIHGEARVWAELGLETRNWLVPLYVGKAEDSLVKRELKTHFAVGGGASSTTGSSTVRRSFAALLREPLALQAVPRNIAKPGYFHSYSLTTDGDERLNRWMHRNLTIAVWLKPANLSESLDSIETAVIRAWAPPLNLDKNPARWQHLRDARKAMADEARAWPQTMHISEGTD